MNQVGKEEGSCIARENAFRIQDLHLQGLFGPKAAEETQGSLAGGRDKRRPDPGGLAQRNI